MKKLEKVNLKIELQGIKPSHAKTIVSLLSTMRIMGSHGSSRTLELWVDGDGRFRFDKLLVQGDEVKGDNAAYPCRDYNDPEERDFTFD